MKKIIISASLLILYLISIITLRNYLYLEKSEYEEEKDADAIASLQWMSSARAYPDIDIPQDKFYKAYEHSRENLAGIFETDEPDAWVSIGPNNIGGRSISAAIHPVDTNIIFMGSASGGLWKSTTGGLGASAWTLINTGYPSSAVSSIAIDSANPNVMYIGTGENYGYQYSINNGVNIRVTRGMYGIGILKTTNGGNTWTKSLDWSYNNQRGVWTVLINPKNSNIVYAGTSEGVWKSYNAGNTWNQILNYNMVMDMKMSPVDTSVLFITVGNLTNNVPNANTGIYKTTNSGLNWVKLAGGLPSNWSGKATLDIYRPNPNFIYASIPNDFTYVGYYRSSDGGNTWTLKNTSLSMSNQGWYNNAHLVKPDNPEIILVGSLDIYKSTNGGTSFVTKSSWSAWNTGATPPGDPESSASNYSHADQHLFLTNPKDPNKLYCITDGGLYRSNNFGEVYYSCNGGYVTTQFYGGFANSYQDSVFCIGGLQDNRSAFYQGTVAWYKTFQGDGMWCAINSTNKNICYTEYAYGDIYKSTNGGVSWTDISPPNAGSETYYAFAAPYICMKSNPNILIAAGTSVYRSTAGGGSWQGPYGNLNGGKALSIDASSTGTDTIYLGTIGSGSTPCAIHKSVNGGLNWINVSEGQTPDRYPTDICVNPNNPNEVYAVFGGFGTGHIYKTSNGGINWINISGNLPDIPHQSVVVDPLYPMNVYVGNDLGVYASTNGGQTWGEYKTGMPYALVFDLTIVNVSRKLRATTHGNGVYERKLLQIPTGSNSTKNEIPQGYELFQNYPNPFNPSTTIKFVIPKSSNVIITINDISGKVVDVLVNRKMQEGTYNVQWSAVSFPSGIYFCRMTAGNFSDTKKLILIK